GARAGWWPDRGGPGPGRLTAQAGAGRCRCRPGERTRPAARLMCGLAGLSVAPGSELDLAALLRLLAAGIAERGRDATGFAYHAEDGRVRVVKDSQPLARFLDRIQLPRDARSAL